MSPSTSPSDRDQIISIVPPDLNHRSPDSSELKCKPRELKKAIWAGWAGAEVEQGPRGDVGVGDAPPEPYTLNPNP